MMKYNLLKCLFFIGLIYNLVLMQSCSRDNKTFTKSMEIDSAWSALSITLEYDEQIEINNYNEDTSKVYIHHVGSFFAPVPKNKWHTDTLKAYFTKAEKDTLVYLAKDLIINRAKAKGACTDYVGYLRLNIRYNQFTLNGEYTSVCDWSVLSDKTMQLYKILKRHIKNVYTGG